jgi:hypothetical protein
MEDDLDRVIAELNMPRCAGGEDRVASVVERSWVTTRLAAAAPGVDGALQADCWSSASARVGGHAAGDGGDEELAAHLLLDVRHVLRSSLNIDWLRRHRR